MHTEHSSTKKIKVAIIVSIPSFFVHIINNIKEYKKAGFEVHLISSKAAYSDYLRQNHNMDLTDVFIARDISPWNDLKSLWQLYTIFRKHKYDIVHSGTPKAGLLVAIAGWLARVPVRLHTFTGQRWATVHGPLRFILKKLDQLVITLNTRCYADSKSQITYLIEEGVARPNSLYCLHKGSYGGIDIARFRKDKFPQARAEIAHKLDWPLDVSWILFVGRVTYDKGVKELIEAFTESLTSIDARLLLLGDPEGLVPDRDSSWLNTMQNNSKIKQISFQINPEYYMSSCDFLCLPSHREGFGTVVIESAALGICTLGTDIPGLKDAIINEQTGLLVPLQDKNALKEAIIRLVQDSNLRKTLSDNAHQRAVQDFDFHIIANLQMKDYHELTALNQRS